LDPAVGNVAFGSGLHRWGFTLRHFAHMYAKKFKVDENKFMSRLWGENYFNPTIKKWNKTGGEGYVRGFNKFVLEPLYKVHNFFFQTFEFIFFFVSWKETLHSL